MQLSLRKKLALIFAAVLFTLIFLVLCTFDWILEKSIEAVAPKMTQTEVEVGSVGLSPLLGRFSISNLQIGNPKGYEAADALHLGKLKLGIRLRSLFASVKEIDELSIQGLEVNWEGGLTSSNLNQIEKNINEFTKNLELSGPSNKKSKSDLRLRIHRLVMEDVKVHIISKSLVKADFRFPIPRIEIKNIGSGPEGASVDHIAAAALSSLSAEIVSGIGKSIKSKGFGFFH
jgi:hypothetical protein